MYGNQAAVSKGIKAAGVSRDKLFITDKLPSSRHSRAKENLDETLASLGTDYVDLFLIHWPVALNPDGNDPKIPTKPDGSRDILGASSLSFRWSFPARRLTLMRSCRRLDDRGHLEGDAGDPQVGQGEGDRRQQLLRPLPQEAREARRPTADGQPGALSALPEIIFL